MKYYTRKPTMVVAFQLDFSTPEKTMETLKNLEHCSHILIHYYGDRGYGVKLDGTDKEFEHGDYIYTYVNSYKWYGSKQYNFESEWEERE